MAEEGLSNENGSYNFSVRQVGTLLVVASKAGFIQMTKKINVTSGFLESKDQFGSYLVTLPMF